jgi:methionyl-tRNA formyltransferase
VDASETAATLYDKHLICLREMLAALVPAFQRDALPRTPQDHAKASFCARRTADDGYIDWQRPAEEIWTLIRATTEPYPGAFTVYASRKAIIWSADLVGDAPYFGLPGQIQDFVDGDALVQCGDGRHVRLRRVEFAGDGDAAPPQLKRHERFGVSPVPRW